MDYTYILSQIFGILGVIFNMLAIKSKSKKTLLFWSIASNASFVINMLLLKAYSGTIVQVITCMQVISLWIFERKNQKLPKWMYLFYIIISLIGLKFSYKSITDIIPTIAFTLYTVSLLYKAPQTIRIFNLIIVTMWTIYNFVIKSYATFAIDFVQVFFIAYNIIKNIKTKEINDDLEKSTNNI